MLTWATTSPRGFPEKFPSYLPFLATGQNKSRLVHIKNSAVGIEQICGLAELLKNSLKLVFQLLVFPAVLIDLVPETLLVQNKANDKDQNQQIEKHHGQGGESGPIQLADKRLLFQW